MSASAKRIPSLDGIRAVSISLVIICHFARDVGWGDRFDLGSLGVRIFFVISGYLITGLLLKELAQDGRISLIRFYFRRALRIFPAFYFYLGCMLLIGAFGWVELTFRQALPALTYTSNYFVPTLQRTVAHTWSLATEEQFYLIWPAALALVGRRRGLLVLLTLLVAAPLSSHFLSSRLHYAVPAFFNEPIGIGCLLALTRARLHASSLYRRFVHTQLGLLLPVLVFACNLPVWHHGGLRDAVSTLLLNLCIALSLDWAVVNGDSLPGRFLNSRPMIYIGVLSYSLYLWQQPFLALHGDHPALLLRGPWTILMNPALRLALIVLCTLGSYYLVERPLLHLRTRLEPMWFARKAPPAVAPSPSTADIRNVEA